MESDLVEVCAERFAKLEELEKNLPEIIKKAIIDYKNENLRKLHERDKNNPEAVKNRVKKYISKNKDKINEKRREKRKEKTEDIVCESIAVEDTPHELNMVITVNFNA